MADLLDDTYGAGDPRWLEAEDIGRRPTPAFNPWALPRLPPREMRDPVKDRPRDTFAETVGESISPVAGGMGLWDLGRSTVEAGRDANWAKVADELPMWASVALPVPGMRGRARNKSLEQFVDELKQPRDGRQPLFDYEKYLSDPLRTVNARDRAFETQEPEAKRDLNQNVKNLSHYRRMDDLREKRDAGMYEGPQGHPVNPWYWPAPVYDAFSKELGPELAHDRLSKFLNYNATTSMMTRVPRNAIEAWTLLHHDLNDIPFNRLNAGELIGGAYPNKVKLSGDVAEGRGIMGDTAHKIRNYSLNLHGVGTAEPVYKPGSAGNLERVLSPTTLDSIMAEAMRLRGKDGEPRERFVGPIYREGMKVIDKLGDEVGMANADTQASIWQTHQGRKYPDDNYSDPYARILDDVINRVAVEQGEDPKRVLADMIHGRRRPPNIFQAAPLAPLAGILMDYYGNEEGPQ